MTVTRQNIMVNIRGTQEDAEDSNSMELYTEGMLTHDDEKYIIEYDESELSGLGNTKTQLTVEGERVQLRFRIARNAGLHLMETPLSSDQKVVELEDGQLEVTATVVDSAMLEWWLRGFGDSIVDVLRHSAPSSKSSPKIILE